MQLPSWVVLLHQPAANHCLSHSPVCTVQAESTCAWQCIVECTLLSSLQSGLFAGEPAAQQQPWHGCHLHAALLAWLPGAWSLSSLLQGWSLAQRSRRLIQQHLQGELHEGAPVAL